MALPPRITVKRRRDEDPVEALYIQKKKQRPSAVWKLVGDELESPRYESNSGPSSTLGGTQSKKTHPAKRTIPSTRHALPETVVTEDGRDQSQVFREDLEASYNKLTAAHKPPTLLTIPQPAEQDAKRGGAQKGVSEPRRFHLSRKTLSKSSPQSPSGHGVRKHRRNDLAVFVEKAKKMLNSSSAKQKTGTGAKKSSASEPPEEVLNDAEPSQKRPNATAVEKVWRAENWSKPVNRERSDREIQKSGNSVNQPSDTWNYDSMELAEQLQQIALEEIQAQGQETASHRRSQGKIHPKAPKPRHSRVQVQSGSLVEEQDEEASSHPGDDDDYVFDTYVRSSAPPTGALDSTLPYVDALKNIDQGHVGILVIEEDEESLWETFGEDQESDPEWDSEEEDENAEDYYGNDYPEDEVNSDDEFGRGAYNFRKHGSEDEEFGYEEPEWSDEDERARRPWALGVGNPRNAADHGDDDSDNES